MKTLIIAGLMAATTVVSAQPFEFQKRFGSTEYDHFADTRQMQFADVTPSGRVSSLERVMLAANVDSIAPNRFEGEIVTSGPTRISLYEVQRDSPEGIAYRDYHERYPIGTDWQAIADNWSADHGGDS